MSAARFLLALLALVLGLNTAVAQDWARGEFDARLLSQQEKRIVQAALTYTGDYAGLLDGAWGKRSQAALEAYARRVHGNPKPTFADLTIALTALRDEWTGNGWRVVMLNEAGMSLLFPGGLMVHAPRPEHPGEALFSAADGSITMKLEFSDAAGAVQLHDYLVRTGNQVGQPYMVRRNDLMVSRILDGNGLESYFRTDPTNSGLAMTHLIFATSQRQPILWLISASFQKGQALGLDIPPHGLLAELMAPVPMPDPAPTYSYSGVDPSGEGPNHEPEEIAPTPAAALPGQSQGAPSITGSGTGFYVTHTDLVTAAHVVEGCVALQLPSGAALEVTHLNLAQDLALLSSSEWSRHWLILSAEQAPVLGAEVMALGYPYLGTLGQGQTVTRGNVSALQGIDGSQDQFMISAPVQPGNSGGPLLDETGAVAGVVVARVNDLAVLRDTGTLPQNMNFAVSNSVLSRFLSGAGVEFSTEATGVTLADGLPPAVIAATVPVFCLK